jgi:DNA polymerase III subunit alpha
LSFVHLHTHSEFSLLDGANRIPDLVKRAKELEMPALALTDHGCLYGAWTFHKTAKKNGLQPIIGMEAYVAPGSRKDKTRGGQGERAYYHLVLLARDLEGYKNLAKLSSIGYTEGFYGRPRVDREVLAQYSKGLVVSSACMAGEVARHLIADNWEGAREAASWYANLFQDRYYLEVQAHDSEGQRELNEKVFKLADQIGLPVVATNDAHFLKSGDHEAHDVLLCIGLGKDKSDPNRMRYDKGLYFKSAQEIAERFPDRPDVLTNTLKIADESRLEFTKTYHLPAFPIPQGYNEDPNAYLEHLARGGMHLRYGLELSEEVKSRFEYELDVIKGTGYAGYFLIVSDLIRWAKAQGIPVGPGRGSAAGSIVAYALGITNLDPIVHDLLFERFLNPERISMPDIDIDFCFERRGEVIDYTRKLYGAEAVGQIITFGTMKSRAVIRDVGRTLGFEPSETDRIAKLIPNAPNQSFTVEEAVKGIAEIKDLYKSDERHKRLFDYAMTLEGLSRHASVHAAGIVIAPGPLSDYVPVCIQPKGNGGTKSGNGDANGEGALDDAMAVTQFDMNALDDVGLLKIDFLGLKTLTVIHDAVEAVTERVGELKNPETGVVYESMDDVPLDDPTVYKMLARGGTQGIFQFESSLAIDKLRQMRCDRFEDLVATNALIRPGPLDSGMDQVYVRRKLGLEPVKYAHPDLEKTLDSTYGIIVYQEQVMRIANVLAGYTLGEADVLRKAVGKKDAALIKAELERFVKRSVERGVEKRTATELADQIETFGRYGFNRCVIGDTEIVDASTGRVVTIQDAYEGKDELCKVFALDRSRMRLVEAYVSEIFDNGVKPVYRLRTESGREIEATANHPFLTFEGWKNLEELSEGEHLAVPRSLPTEGSVEWPDHQVIALGHLVAEGNLCHPHGLYVYHQDEALLTDFVRAAEGFRNVRCTLGTHHGTGYAYTGRVHRKKPNGIFGWADGLGLLGKTATQKELPALVFMLGNEQIGLLLSRMWEGDGHVGTERRGIYYATSSERLAKQVQHLLLRLGIIARTRSVQFRYRGGLKTGYQVHITSNEHYARFDQLIARHFVTDRRRNAAKALVLSAPEAGPSKDVIPVAIRGRVRELKAESGLAWKEVEAGCGVSIRDFHPVGSSAEKVGFTRTHLSAVADYFDDPELKKHANSDILWDRIKSIEYVGEKRTFDLEVPVHHNFVANDIIVHNSHAAAYSLISYHTAWLKAHYPAEYMAALLSSVIDHTDDVVTYIAECRDLHRSVTKLEGPIEVLPPDVNQSGWKFTPVNGLQIRFGLGAVRGVGAMAVKSILDARAAGPFKSLFDFLERIDLRALNKRACEALVAAGALDAFGHRAQLFAGLERAYQEASARRAELEAGQASLFGGDAGATMQVTPTLPNVPDWPEQDRLAREKEALGFFISGHPLDRYRDVVYALGGVNTRSLGEKAGQKIELACVVTGVQRQISRKDGSEWGKVTVEDFHGTATVLSFKEAWQSAKERMKQDAVVLLKGMVSGRERDEEDPPIFLDEVILLGELERSGQLAVQIEMEVGSELPADAFARAKAALAGRSGTSPVELLVAGGNGKARNGSAPAGNEAALSRLRSRTLRVDPGPETLAALREVFGKGMVRLVRVGVEAR